MDADVSPFTPGAVPEVLAGRDAAITFCASQIRRATNGRSARNSLFYGLRGTGKTSLLTEIERRAGKMGAQVCWLEPRPDRPFIVQLVHALNEVLKHLDRLGLAKSLIKGAANALSAVVQSVEINVPGFSIKLGGNPDKSVTASGDFDADVTALFEALGAAASAGSTALVLIADEMQSVPPAELRALIAALQTASRKRLPVVMVGAGTPNLLGRLVNAPGYTERMFKPEAIGPLDRTATMRAFRKTLGLEGVKITADALDRLWEETEGYPHFIQEWGQAVWLHAENVTIQLADVQAAAKDARAALDDGFYKLRMELCTAHELAYLKALASLGPGEHGPGAVAKAFGVASSRQLNSTRQHLIDKGLIFAPSYGKLAFTAPKFDAFVRRAYR